MFFVGDVDFGGECFFFCCVLELDIVCEFVVDVVVFGIGVYVFVID